MSRRVVVTGMGAVTPIGNNVKDFWENVKKGTVGIGPITKFDTTDYKAHLDAEVKDFDPTIAMDKKSARRMEDFAQYAVVAAKEALEDSGLDMEKEDPFMVGCSVGCGIGSLQCVQKNYEKILTKGPNRVAPLMIPMLISNMAAGNISIQFGLKGKNINVVTACATGTHCIGEGYRSIQYGEADVMVAGGSEGAITELGVAGFTGLNALNTTDDPKRASIPFDVDRGGFVMGSDSDMPVMAKAADILDKLGISYEMTIISAHREPDVFFEYAKTAEQKGFKVIIAGAGMAAHLPGMCAAIFPMPVIGIPMHTTSLGGRDSLYSIVQMPTGIPVATVAINGGANAGILAAKILATSDEQLLERLKNYTKELKESVQAKDARLQEVGYKNYAK